MSNHNRGKISISSELHFTPAQPQQQEFIHCTHVFWGAYCVHRSTKQSKADETLQNIVSGLEVWLNR